MPKTQVQNIQIKDRRKNDMIVAATRIFSFTNYKDVTIDQIANELNCSHGLFYHYFKSKHDIFCAVMDKSLEEAASLFNLDFLLTIPAIDSIKHITTNLLKTMSDGTDYHNSVLYLLINSRLQADANFKDEDFIKQCCKATDRLHDLIKTAQEQGDIYPGNPTHYTMCYVALMKGLLFNRLYIGREIFQCPSVSTIMHLLEVSK